MFLNYKKVAHLLHSMFCDCVVSIVSVWMLLCDESYFHFLCMCFLLLCVRVQFSSFLQRWLILPYEFKYVYDAIVLVWYLFVSFCCTCSVPVLHVLGCYAVQSIVVFMFAFLSCPSCRSSLFVSFTDLRVSFLLYLRV